MFDLNLTFFLESIIFAVLFAFFYWFFIPKIRDILKERAEKVAMQISAAQKNNLKSFELLQKRTKSLKEGREEAVKIKNIAVAEAQKYLQDEKLLLRAQNEQYLKKQHENLKLQMNLK